MFSVFRKKKLGKITTNNYCTKKANKQRMCFEGFVGPFYSFLSKTNAICLLVTVTQSIGNWNRRKRDERFCHKFYFVKANCMWKKGFASYSFLRMIGAKSLNQWKLILLWSNSASVRLLCTTTNWAQFHNKIMQNKMVIEKKRTESWN